MLVIFGTISGTTTGMVYHKTSLDWGLLTKANKFHDILRGNTRHGQGTHRPSFFLSISFNKPVLVSCNSLPYNHGHLSINSSSKNMLGMDNLHSCGFCMLKYPLQTSSQEINITIWLLGGFNGHYSINSAVVFK